MENNVVVFPKAKRNTPPQSLEEIQKNRDEVTKEHIEYLLEDLVGMIIGASYDAGFNLSKDDTIQSTILLSESIKAALYRARGLDHPLHAFSDNVDMRTIAFTKVLSQTHLDEPEKEE